MAFTVPFTFVNGTVAEAGSMNSNFTAVETEIDVINTREVLGTVPIVEVIPMFLGGSTLTTDSNYTDFYNEIHDLGSQFDIIRNVACLFYSDSHFNTDTIPLSKLFINGSEIKDWIITNDVGSRYHGIAAYPLTLNLTVHEDNGSNNITTNTMPNGYAVLDTPISGTDTESVNIQMQQRCAGADGQRNITTGSLTMWMGGDILKR